MSTRGDRVTRDEWNILKGYLTEYYQKYRHFLTKDKECEVWFGYFAKMDYEIGKDAVNMSFARCSYPPTIQQILEIYKEIVEDRQAQNKQVYEIYREMETYYPMSLRDDDRIEAFKTAISSVESHQRINTARLIHNRVIGRVKDAERGNVDNLPVLSECIRECVNESDRSGIT